MEARYEIIAPDIIQCIHHWAVFDNVEKVNTATFHMTLPYAQGRAIEFCHELNKTKAIKMHITARLGKVR